MVVDQNSATAYTVVVNGQRTKPANGSLAPIGPLSPGQCVSLDNNLNTVRGFGRLDEHNVSWRAGLDFKPFRHTLLYANVSKGFKGGSSPAPAATSIVQLQPVRQESVLAYEVGVKSTLIDRLLDVSAAGFYYDYRDKQLLGRAVFTPNIFGALGALVNVPRSRVAGAEAQVTVRPAHGLTLSAAGTYLDTRVLGSFVNYDIIGQQSNFGGSIFPYTPK